MGLSLLTVQSYADFWGDLFSVGKAVADEFTKCIDNSSYNFREDSDFKGLITAAEAISSGEGGAAMVGIKVAGNIIGSAGGLDMSTFNQVMDNSMNNLVADPHSNSSTEMNVVGALLHSAEEVAYLAEDRLIIAKDGQRNEEYISQVMANASDPESPYYDPYFNCKYEIVTISEGKYGSSSQTLKKQEDMQAMMDCIREIEEAQAEESFREYMQEEYGLNMSYEEYTELPVNQRPSLEAYVFPEQQKIENIINEPTLIDEVIEEDQIVGHTEPIIEQPIITTPDDELLESIKTSDYKFNSYALSEENKAELDKAAEILLRNPEWEIELLGHSCDFGDKEAKYIIGIQRAKVAKQYLVEKGVDAKHIYVHSYADKKPVVPNNSVENRAANRRVEIKIIK